MRDIRIGRSGWSYEYWRDGVFSPPRLAVTRRLAYYAEQFTTVELNATFYRLPTRRAAARWADDTPEEFRHPSGVVPDVLERLREHGVALVIADRPELHAFQPHELTGPVAYLRFHHGSRGRRGNSDRELAEWSGRIAHWAHDRPVWAFFNNDWEGFASANARALVAKVA